MLCFLATVMFILVLNDVILMRLFVVLEQVALFYDDGRPVEQKGVGRKVLDKVHETYHSDLDGKQFAYDGEKTLFTFGALPSNKMDFSVVLEEVSSAR